MLTVLAASLLQGLGDLLVGGIVLGLMIFGVQNGLFLAVLAGMHALLSFVVALAFAEPLAALLVSFELPELYAFPAAFGLLLVGTAFGIRLAVGEYVPADVVRFAPLVDKLGGALVGAVVGMVIAGTFLVAASIAPLPEAFRLDGSKLHYDMGTRLLRTFARCVEPDEAKRAVFLDGEPGSVPPPPPAAALSPPTAAAGTSGSAAAGSPGPSPAETKPEQSPAPVAAPPVPRWSEPFADLNGNKAYDDGEPYLDTDKDGAFTPRLVLNDGNGNGLRDVGLLERYRMHAWGRKVISIQTIDELMGVAIGQPPVPGGPAVAAPAADAPAAQPPAKKRKR